MRTKVNGSTDTCDFIENLLKSDRSSKGNLSIKIPKPRSLERTKVITKAAVTILAQALTEISFHLINYFVMIRFLRQLAIEKPMRMKASHYNNFKMNSSTVFNAQVPPLRFHKEFEHFQRGKQSFHQVSSKLNADNTNKYRTLNNHLKWNVIKRQFRKIHRHDHHQRDRNRRNHQQDIEKVSENKHVQQALLSRDKMLEIINSAMMIKRTADIVDELSLNVSDETVKLRLNHFSSLIHNLRAYSIFAVITLDGSLIFRIISTTTTYIIILLQYSGEGDICKATESDDKTV
uniref:Gustatory receptor n=1 Tax=Glossina palpalis gambiensis TaxID=67801 RepID=A0A1B0BRN4_9MUSC